VTTPALPVPVYRLPAAAVAARVSTTAPERLPFRTDLCLLLLIATQPIESAFGTFGGLSITKFAGALCIGAFVLDWMATRRKLLFDETHAIVLSLMAIAVISAVQARYGAVAFDTVLRLAGFAALYVILTQFPRSDVLVRVAWVLSAASALAAALALRNFTDGATLLAKPTHGDANDLAYLLATSLPIALWLLSRPGAAGRAVTVLMVAVITTGIALTFSRGAMIALGAGWAWFVATERRFRRILLSLGAAGLVALLLYLPPEQGRVAVGLTAKGRIAAENVESRRIAWRTALALTERNLLVGIGPGNFPAYYTTESGAHGAARSFVVHNTYLEVAAELGLPALVLFVLFMGVAFVRLSESVRRGLGPPWFAIAARTALVVAIVGAIPLSEEYYLPLWLLGAVATMVWAADTSRSSTADESPLRQHA